MESRRATIPACDALKSFFGGALRLDPLGQFLPPGNLAFVIFRCVLRRLEGHQLRHGCGEVALRHSTGDLLLG